MSNDQIDTAIAEFRGWTEIKTVGSGRLYGYRPNSYGQAFRFTAVPQYHKCLNACNEAEQFTWAKEWLFREDFVDYLARIINQVHGYRNQAAFDLLDATAMQRAEALLRTIGKWQESEKPSTHCAV